MSRQAHAALWAACHARRCSRVAFSGMRWDRCHSLLMATIRFPSRYIALTMFSVTFLASPSSIMVLSR